MLRIIWHMFFLYIVDTGKYFCGFFFLGGGKGCPFPQLQCCVVNCSLSFFLGRRRKWLSDIDEHRSIQGKHK